jgi:Dolichyl-phosphate-mannose-protein mannosyltransferase
MPFKKAEAVIRRVEWGVAIAATAILVGLHVAFLFSAGALWRDEVNCVNVANLSSLKETWANLQYDSFPIFWFIVLRAWTRIGPGTSDFGIRTLGLLVGLGVLALIWKNARVFGRSVPLVSLTLLGFNSTVISYGDAIRGHGLGMLTGLLTFGLLWEAVDAPTPRHLGLAMLAALVAVQCLYFNAVFILAACLGGAAVAFGRRSWKSASLVMGIGAACAISFLPYAGTIRDMRDWNMILRVDVDMTWIWRKLEEAFVSTGGWVLWVWIGAAALAVAAALRAQLRSAASALSERDRDAALYCGVVLVTGLLGYAVFLKNLGYFTQPWYYVTLMVLVAACLDAPIGLLARTLAARGARLIVIVVVAALVIQPVWTTVRTRKTNVDLVASKVGQLAVTGDLIVVNPWYVGITFDRYYHGKADWITIPPLSSHALHRYDLLKERMKSDRPIAPVLEGMQNALQGGHRVFWVGDLFVPKEGEVPPNPPPAPLASWGWSDGPYYYYWGLQAGYLMKSHAQNAAAVEVPLQQAVSAYEEAWLYVIDGWRDGDGTR